MNVAIRRLLDHVARRREIDVIRLVEFSGDLLEIALGPRIAREKNRIVVGKPDDRRPRFVDRLALFLAQQIVRRIDDENIRFVGGDALQQHPPIELDAELLAQLVGIERRHFMAHGPQISGHPMVKSPMAYNGVGKKDLHRFGQPVRIFA